MCLFSLGPLLGSSSSSFGPSRSDDLQGLVPSTMELGTKGLFALLRRSKTSGPGKRVKWLPIFVDRHASFTGKEWLEIGFSLWQQDGFSFERDYSVLRPSHDLGSCLQVCADYTALSAMSKTLLMSLRLPAWTSDGWVLCHHPLFIAHSACRAWGEHSERCWLTSVAALLEVVWEQRDYLGRWRAASSCDEYVRTAQQIVCNLQRKIVTSALAGETSGLWDLGLKELGLHLREAGENDCTIQSLPDGDGFLYKHEQ